MEQLFTLFVKENEEQAFKTLVKLLNDDEFSGDRLSSLFPSYETNTPPKLPDLEGEFFQVLSVTRQDGYCVAQFGEFESEASLSDLVEVLGSANVEDVRILSEGEYGDFTLIRWIDGSVESRHWEEEDPEIYISYQQWFNEGLPDSLKVDKIKGFD